MNKNNKETSSLQVYYLGLFICASVGLLFWWFLQVAPSDMVYDSGCNATLLKDCLRY